MMSDVEADFRKHLFGPTSGGNDEVSQAEKLETVGAQKPQEPLAKVKGYRATNQRLGQNRQAADGENHHGHAVSCGKNMMRGT